MNTSELVAKLAETHGVSKAQAKSIVDDILKDIVDAAASGAEVSQMATRSRLRPQRSLPSRLPNRSGTT